MKSRISYVLAFLLMVIIVLIVVLFFGEVSIRQKNVSRVLNKVDYYDKAYDNIINKIDDFVINEDIKNDYVAYVDKNLVKKDINAILLKSFLGEDVNVSHYDDFKGIISKYTKDDVITDKYASYINDIYVKNLFPTKIYNFVLHFYIKTTIVVYLFIILSVLFLLISLVLFILNRNIKYHILSLLSSGICLILPSCVINISGIFKDFIYTNSYFTSFLLNIVYDALNSYLVLGTIFVIGAIFYKMFEKKKKCNN